MKMKSHSKIWNYLCYAGLEENEYLAVKERVNRSNLKILLFREGISLLAMIVSALIDSIKELLPFSNTFSGWFYSGEVLYVSTGISSLLLVLLTLLAKFRNWPTWPLVWLFSLLLSVYAIWTTLQNPSSQATTVMVFMVLLPTMFVLAPWKRLVAILLLVIIFNLLAWEYKTPASYTADSWNSVFFGTVGVISGFYFDRVMLIGWLDGVKSKFLSENDLLTGIKNRNYYQERIKQLLRPAKSSVTFVFCDVNGLHETNNLLGHEAGDRMLIALANELVRYFGHELSFRFGGDEFLAVALDGSLPEVEKKCDQLQENLQKQGYHVSLGISQQRVDQLELKQLLFEADKVMRQAKAAYYQDTEHDRQAR